MTLSLPSIPKLAASTFDLMRFQAFNPLKSGDHQVVELREPRWVCDLDTTELSRAIGGEYKLLVAQLKGFGTLYLYDPSRPRPLAYHDGGSWGTPLVQSVSRANSTITLSGFVAGAVISAGDLGCWDDGPARRLHILGGGTADGSGALTVEVEPAPPATATATLPVAFTMEKPCAEFALIENSIRFSAPVVQELSLRAVQVFRRSTPP